MAHTINILGQLVTCEHELLMFHTKKKVKRESDVMIEGA